MNIKKVVSKKDLKDFITMPARLYRNDPYWVRPLDMDMFAKFNPKKNPFFEHAEVQPFIAVENNKIVGRIAGIINYRHNEVHEEKAAFFGFFESENDVAISSRLLDTVCEWAKEKGMSFVRGPANFSSNDEWGLLVDGFDSSPMIMMTYNPKYYINLIEQSGFVKEKDLLAYILDATAEIPERLKRAYDIILKRTGVNIRTLRMNDFENEVKEIQFIYNKAWEKNWGFVPMTENEIQHLAQELKPVCDPDLVFIAEKDNNPVGFAMALPDYNQLLKPLKGKLYPFGIFYLLLNKKKVTAGRLLTLGLIKEYRNTGIEALFYLKMWEAGKKKGYLEGELSWILEDNMPMRNGIEKVGGKVYKTYRIYRKNL